jgi:hypothetical protein
VVPVRFAVASRHFIIQPRPSSALTQKGQVIRMALKNIFSVENTGTRPIEDVVGRFRSGHQLNKRPVALSDWRVTSDDPTIADTIAKMFGGERQEWDSEREPYEVFTTVSSISIVMDAKRGLHTGMVLYGRAGAIRRCDGMALTYPKEQAGTPCACAGFSSLADRKAAAQNGTGCSPEIVLRFRLADAPEIGEFKFVTGSWSMARDIAEVENALSAHEGNVRATLTLENVEFTTKEGVNRKFTKPVLKVIGPA